MDRCGRKQIDTPAESNTSIEKIELGLHQQQEADRIMSMVAGDRAFTSTAVAGIEPDGCLASL